MARSIWNGTIVFGLVAAPVKVHSATESKTVHFRECTPRTRAGSSTAGSARSAAASTSWARTRSSRSCTRRTTRRSRPTASARTGTSRSRTTRAPTATRPTTIEAFVDVEDVDPIFFDHPYVLTPAGDSEGTPRASRLLTEVMSRTDRAALGRFVLRTTECARPGTSRKPAKKDRPAKKEVDQAVALIEALASPWDASRYEDTFQRRLQKIGRQPDLMAAPDKTLEEVKAGSR